MIGSAGSSLVVTGDLTSAGFIAVGDNQGGGGSTLTVKGKLVNSGTIALGNTTLTAPDAITVGDFQNTGYLTITGNTDADTTAKATFDAGAAVAPSELEATIFVVGDAEFDYASGTITTIAASGQLDLEGPRAQINDKGVAGADSALAITKNEGGLILNNGVALTLADGLDNSSVLDVDIDQNFYPATPTGGSSLVILGDVTNSYYIGVGNGSLTIMGTLDNTGSSFYEGTTVEGHISLGGLVTSDYFALGAGAAASIAGSASASGYSASVSLDQGASLSATALTLADGATLDVTAATIAAPVTIGSGSSEAVEKGVSSQAGTLLQGGRLEIQDGASLGSAPIVFGGYQGVLQIDSTTVMPSNEIDGFSHYGKIALWNVNYDASAPAPVLVNSATEHNVLEVTENGTVYRLQLDPNHDYGGVPFEVVPEQHDMVTFATIEIACYARGTLIATEIGETPVEALTIGQRLVTAAGTIRPIRWIGTRSYAGRFANGNHDVLPICFKAGSLADRVPRRDLWVSPKHAMFLDGVLIPAEHLVNGVSVVQAAEIDRVDYFHIELDSHDVIVAEGALSETFVDDDSRAMFHNAREFAALYADAAAVPARYCAPRVETGFVLEAVRRKLAERAGIVGDEAALSPFRGTLDIADNWGVGGWAQNLDSPEGAVCLDVFVDGVLAARTLANRYRDDLRAAGIGSGAHGFRLAWDRPLAIGDHVVEVRRSSDGAGLWCSPRLITPARTAA